MKAFHTIAVPHKDVLEGRLTLDVFAADLWQVFNKKGPDEYKDAKQFFNKTFVTKGLNNLLKILENRLKAKGGDPVIQIQTPFGGGKTHSLIAMFHKAEEWKAKKVVLVGTSISTKETLWGQLEKQLTGKTKKFSDYHWGASKADIIALLIQHQPILILMDEVLEYITKAAGVKVGGSTLASQTMAFMQALTEAISSIEKAALVVTLPSSIMEHYDEQSEKLFGQLQKVSGRVEKIYTPVQENEISYVIKQRLFSDIDKAKANETIKEFMEYAVKENLLPAGTEPSEYRKRFEASFPFLPEVIDILYHRWGSFPNFQRTRNAYKGLKLASRTATTIFLYSFSGGQEKGATLGEIKLNATTTQNPSSVIVEALEDLRGKLFYFQQEAGKTFFSNQPNLNRILLTKIENIVDKDIDIIEKELVKKSISGRKLGVFAFPEKESEIPDNIELKLVILKEKDDTFMKNIIEKKGATPRVYRNTIFFLVPLEMEQAGFLNSLKRAIAYKQISDDKTINLSDEHKRQVKNEIKKHEEGLNESLRRYYRVVCVPTKDGFKEIDLGIPTLCISVIIW